MRNGSNCTHVYNSQIFVALLQPSSADGRALRIAFAPRVIFRLKDAIAKEARERRIPDETEYRAESKANKKKAKNGVTQPTTDELGSEGPHAESDGTSEFDDAGPWKPSSSHSSDEIDHTDENIDVSRILECVPD
jgi:hypothetical protein